MEDSILKSTKHVLGVPDGYDVFDEDILMHINSALATAEHVGSPISTNTVVQNDATTWTSLAIGPQNLNLLRTYVYLKVRLLFDPPPTSFALSAAQEQIKEFESRMSMVGEVNV